MPDFYTELWKVLGTGSVGVWVGFLVKKLEARAQIRRAEDDRWAQEKQSHWSPLLEAARDLKSRFRGLTRTYEDEKTSGKALHDGYPGNFCELYVLDRGKTYELDENLEAGDPITPRKDAYAVERTRARMCHQLTYAASSLYITAKYLGVAERVLRDLKEGALMLSGDARTGMADRIAKVRASLQGEHQAAGIYGEQQESIGEMVWADPAGRLITNYEFRKRLFEPGWEEFIGLLRFFVHFHKKFEHEVAGTIEALAPLIDDVERLCDCQSKREYEARQRSTSQRTFWWRPKGWRERARVRTVTAQR